MPPLPASVVLNVRTTYALQLASGTRGEHAAVGPTILVFANPMAQHHFKTLIIKIVDDRVCYGVVTDIGLQYVSASLIHCFRIECICNGQPNMLASIHLFDSYYQGITRSAYRYTVDRTPSIISVAALYDTSGLKPRPCCQHFVRPRRTCEELLSNWDDALTRFRSCLALAVIVATHHSVTSDATCNGNDPQDTHQFHLVDHSFPPGCADTIRTYTLFSTRHDGGRLVYQRHLASPTGSTSLKNNHRVQYGQPGYCESRRSA